MKSGRLNYVVVGTFVLAMLAGIVFAVTLLTGRTGATDDYFTTYQDATGLKFGSRVFYMGYPVGQVEAIDPEVVDDQIQFRLRLALTEELEDWQVPDDSVAQIVQGGLLAAIAIDIRAGESKQFLVPGDDIAGLERTDLFSALSETANTIKRLTETDIKPLIATLNRSVQTLGRAIETDGAPMLANLNRLTEHLADRAPEVVTNFLETSADIRATSASLRKILSGENADKVDMVVDNVLAASENIAGLSEEARTHLNELIGPEITAQVRKVVANVSGASEQLDEILGEENAALVRSSLTSLESASSDIKGVTVRLSERAPEILDSVHATSADIKHTSENIRRIVSGENADKVDRMVDNLANASDDIVELSRDGRAQINALLGPHNTDRVGVMVENFTHASGTFRELGEDAKQRLGAVLHDEHIDKLRATLANLESASTTIDGQVARILHDDNVAHVDQILDDVNSASAALDELIADVRTQIRGLLGPGTVEKVDTALTNVSKASVNIAVLSANLNERLDIMLNRETAAKVRDALDNFSKASANVARLTHDLNSTRAALDQLLASLDGAVTENRPDVRRSITHLRFTLQTVSQHIAAVSQNIEGTSRNMYEFSRQLRNNPGVLLRSGTAQETAETTTP